MSANRDTSSAISVRGLAKSYGELQAVKGISFEVERGAVFSLLGPNGSGKSTTISMLSCLLKPNAGAALIMGHSIHDDPAGVKRAIGVVPQELAVYEDLTADENLRFWGKMYGLRGPALNSRVEEVLDVTGLRERLTHYRGRAVRSTGDGFLATFDGPSRAINCATALVNEVRPIGLEIRVGLHAGFVEEFDGEIRGIAVHIANRVMSLAGPGAVLVSRTLKDLVVGTHFHFEDRGEHQLKGVPDEWRLFAVLPGTRPS